MRKAVLVFVLLALLVGAAFAGRKFYRHWKTERAMTQARTALEKGDYDKGLLWLRQALNADARRVEAIRLMGDFAELVRSRGVAVLRLAQHRAHRRILDLLQRSTIGLGSGDLSPQERV